MKKCTRCKKTGVFGKNKANKDGLNSWCNECRNKSRREYGIKNKEKLAEKKKEWGSANKEYVLSSAKAYSLKWRYGLSPEDYAIMLVEQKGVCKICGNPPEKLSLAVDHDHATGKIRGLLCSHCNTAIGQLKDNPELLRKAAQYLEEA